MKRTILIPTDFSIESLKFLLDALQAVETGSINIVFLHCEHITDSIFSLLFYSKKERINSLITPAFQDAWKIIRSRYSSEVNSARVEIFNGYTQASFENFLNGNHIDEIIVPENYSLQLNNNSFDPLPFIRRATVPITEVTRKPILNRLEKNQLAELFLT
jgi:hypothetical protein